MPNGRFDARSLMPHYMLLSYKKSAKASSVTLNHDVSLALNEDIRTWWSAKGGCGEWYQLDLGKVYAPHSIQLNLAEEEIPVMKHDLNECSPDFDKRYIDSGLELKTRYLMEGSQDGSSWFTIKDASQSDKDLSHDYILLQEGLKLRYIKVTAVELPYNAKFSISGLRVFGIDNGHRPATVTDADVVHVDKLTARVSWKKSDGAIGYNFRYGIAPDKLYTSYLIYESEQVLLTALNKGQSYWFCIDSFNESGITEGEVNQL